MFVLALRGMEPPCPEAIYLIVSVVIRDIQCKMAH